MFEKRQRSAQLSLKISSRDAGLLEPPERPQGRSHLPVLRQVLGQSTRHPPQGLLTGPTSLDSGTQGNPLPSWSVPLLTIGSLESPFSGHSAFVSAVKSCFSILFPKSGILNSFGVAILNPKYGPCTLIARQPGEGGGRRAEETSPRRVSGT